MVKRGAAQVVTDGAGLTGTILKLLEDAGYRQSLGQLARSQVREGAGATQKILAQLHASQILLDTERH
jgi:hypothetical protein